MGGDDNSQAPQGKVNHEFKRYNTVNYDLEQQESSIMSEPI